MYVLMCCLQRPVYRLFWRGARSNASRLGSASHCHRPSVLRWPQSPHYAVHWSTAFNKPRGHPASIVSQ